MSRTPVRTRALSIVVGLVVGSGGCEPPGRPDGGLLAVAAHNLYVGADLTGLLSARTDTEVLETVAREYANIQRTDVRRRARSTAQWLAASRPHLVGLQEVSLFRRQSPGDQLSDQPSPATTVETDFLEILLGELAALGVAYREAAGYRGMDVELPLLSGDGNVDDVRLTDRGIVLARADVVTRDPRATPFDDALVVRLGGEGGAPIELVGGWASVVADIDGVSVRFVTTHLESGDIAPAIQESQARQLIRALEGDALPIVLVGDFSSTPDGRSTSTYEMVLEAGFADAWTAAGRSEGGATCCHRADLRNEAPELSRRLDFIFYRVPVSDRAAVLRRRLAVPRRALLLAAVLRRRADERPAFALRVLAMVNAPYARGR